jgi:hypothetical protein
MSEQLANADAVAARIASRQHGVVSVPQLVAAGLNKDQMFHRTRTAACTAFTAASMR